MWTRRNLIITILILAAISIVPIIRAVYVSSTGHHLSPDEKSRKQNIIEVEYHSLFASSERDQVKLVNQWLLAFQHPIAEFLYPFQSTFFVTKWDVQGEHKLTDIIKFETAKKNKSRNVNYRGIIGNNFEFSYASENDSVTEHLVISAAGKFDLESQGDTLLFFSSRTSQVAVQQTENGICDLLFQNNDGPFIDFRILFRKTGTTLYMVVAFPRNEGNSTDDEMIRNIFGLDIDKTTRE